MNAIIVHDGNPKEIAALVLKLQERQKLKFVPETSEGVCFGPLVEGFTTSSEDNQRHPCSDTRTSCL